MEVSDAVEWTARSRTKSLPKAFVYFKALLELYAASTIQVASDLVRGKLILRVRMIIIIVVPHPAETTMTSGDGARPAAANLAALSLGERLLVWTWRKIVTGCPLIAREFCLLCGDDAAEVLATLYTFLQALAYAGRSSWEVGYPGYASLTVDERRMLNLIAAAQSDDTKRVENVPPCSCACGTEPRARDRRSRARHSS
jgi:hypothetical protein